MATTTKKIDTSTVTAEQIARCSRCIDLNGEKPEVFYMVESETDDLTEYKVRWSKEHGYTCTCKSGQNGFSNVRHPSGVCKHVRWSVAAADLDKSEQQALAEREAKQQAEQAACRAKLAKINRLVSQGLTHAQALEAVETYTDLDEEALVRVFKAPAKKKSPAPRNDTRVFSLLK